MFCFFRNGKRIFSLQNYETFHIFQVCMSSQCPLFPWNEAILFWPLPVWRLHIIPCNEKISPQVYVVLQVGKEKSLFSCAISKKKKKCVSQIVYSLQFKQSSLLAGYHNKNLQKQRCLQCILILLASYLEGCYIVLL